MRSLLALVIAKLIIKTLRLFGRGASALPGLVAIKIQPRILEFLVLNNFPRGTIIVTGTNGKTTTTSSIANVLTEFNISYVHNKTGSNMDRGLVSCLVENVGFDGKTSAEVGLFEVDEAFMPKICSTIKPTTVVVTNLFRDQLDRYGELDKIARTFRALFENLDSTQLILNADDPLVASLAVDKLGKEAKYFGVDDYSGPLLKNDRTADSMYDPFTQERLNYSKRYFSHIGKYRSSKEGFSRPKVDYEAKSLKQDGIKSISYKIQGVKKTIKLDMPGIFNVYNSLAAYSAVRETFAVDENRALDAIASSSAAFGRSEVINYKDRHLLFLLIKNPTGLNQIIQTYLLNKNDRLLVFIINDNFADGRDISWLWDASLEDIGGYRGKIVVGGDRAADMALRLKYAGLEDVSTAADMRQLLDLVESNTAKRSDVFVLPTYTAMLEFRSLLVADSETTKEFWK